MFPSAGYFRSANCPFFVHGLCHRPYCHFRHAKPDYKPTSLSTSHSLTEYPVQNDKVSSTEPAKSKVKFADKKQEELSSVQDNVCATNSIFKRTAFEEKLISGNMEEILSESDSDCSETLGNDFDNDDTKRTTNRDSLQLDVDKKVCSKLGPSGTMESKPETIVGDSATKGSDSVAVFSTDNDSVKQSSIRTDQSVTENVAAANDLSEIEILSITPCKNSGHNNFEKREAVGNSPCENQLDVVLENTDEGNDDKMRKDIPPEKTITKESNLNMLIEDLQKYGKGVDVKVQTKKDKVKDENDSVNAKDSCKPEPPKLTDVNFFSSIVVKRSSSKKRRNSRNGDTSCKLKDVEKKNELENDNKLSKERGKMTDSSGELKKDQENFINLVKEKNYLRTVDTSCGLHDPESDKLTPKKKKALKATDTSSRVKDSVKKNHLKNSDKGSKEKKKKKKIKTPNESQVLSTKEKSKIQRYKDLKKLVKDSGKTNSAGNDSAREGMITKENGDAEAREEACSDSEKIKEDLEDDSEESELLRIFNDYNPCDEQDVLDGQDNCHTVVRPEHDELVNNIPFEQRGRKRPSTENAPIGFKKHRVAHQPNHLIQRQNLPSKNASSTFRRLPRPLQGALAPHRSQTVDKQPQGERDIVTSTHIKQRVTHFAKTKPEFTWSARPRIRLEYGAKVPQNVRQKYLDKLVDEYLCVYEDQQEAFDKAEKEEKAIYSKSPRRQMYMNMCVNLIKKLRDGGEQHEDNNEINAGKRNPLAQKSSLPSPQKRLKIDTSGIRLPENFKHTESNSGTTRQGKPAKGLNELTEETFYAHLEKYILSEEELANNGFPRPSNIPGRAEIKDCYGKVRKNLSDPTRHICCRCGKPFVILESGEYRNKEECVYHHGRLLRRRTAGEIISSYTCCQGETGCLGCSVAKAHVKEIDYSEESGFMETLTRSGTFSKKIYAMDCEMCYTTKGLELTRVTVVDYRLQQVYDHLVKPDNAILDYNTRFSGITEESMVGIKTTLREVQAVLLSMIHKDTILLGHSLESDLKSLKLIHSKVVDTSVVFPHRLGPPYKRALRTLMGEFVRKIIQDSEEGHDSLEDAVSCVELMMWKVKEDMKIKEKNKKQ